MKVKTLKSHEGHSKGEVYDTINDYRAELLIRQRLVKKHIKTKHKKYESKSTKGVHRQKRGKKNTK